MAALKSVIHLRREFFGAREQVIVEQGELSASTFVFESGVHAVRLRNSQGELVMLPFQGQQIWSAHFGGRNLTMKSMFDQPNRTQEYLRTYGAFLIHCGFTAMGVPAEGDDHAVHGELPNAPYESATIVLSQVDGVPTLALTGSYRYTVAFSTNYVATPCVTLAAGASLFDIELRVANLKETPMEYMYLAHVNFRPVDNGQLVYSAHPTPETVRVRRSIPSHVTPGPGYVEFIEEVGEFPQRHHLLKPELTFDPELVFTIDYVGDADGWAHSAQVHPDGSADYIGHRVAELDFGVRWICRTPDQDALGIVLPATAGPEGYTAEKVQGRIKTLPAGATWSCAMRAGVLDRGDARTMQAKIAEILGA